MKYKHFECLQYTSFKHTRFRYENDFSRFKKPLRIKSGTDGATSFHKHKYIIPADRIFLEISARRYLLIPESGLRGVYVIDT